MNLETEYGVSRSIFQQWLFISFNALQCADKNWFGFTHVSKDETGKAEVIKLINDRLTRSESLDATPVNLP